MGSLLSIIVPVYNEKEYLYNCIESILNQSYANIEIVLVDDGSTDGSGEICEEYAKRCKQISVIHKKNEGLIRARFTGAKHAAGHYITFVDADDWIDYAMYTSMMLGIENYDFVMCGIHRYYDSDHIVSEKLLYEEGIYDKPDIISKIIPVMLWNADTNRWNLDPSLCTKIFRKEKLMIEFERIKDLGCYFGEDSAVVFPLALHVDKVRLISECHYYHRQRENNAVPVYIRDENFFEKTYNLYQYLKGEFRKSGYWEIMKEQLDHFYFNAIELKKAYYHETPGNLYPIFPFKEIEKNSNVILYGAGKVGKEYMEQNNKYHFCNIILWVDQNYQNIKIEKYKIERPERSMLIEFDYILIAIDIQESAAKVKRYFMDRGVDEKKIIWQSTRIKSFCESDKLGGSQSVGKIKLVNRGKLT